jgi:hypothetical protein
VAKLPLQLVSFVLGGQSIPRGLVLFAAFSFLFFKKKNMILILFSFSFSKLLFFFLKKKKEYFWKIYKAHDHFSIKPNGQG